MPEPADTRTKDIHASALRYLATREHSQKQLLEKLLAKGFAKADITPVLQALVEQGLQSDARYAANYARERIRKGFGPLAIAYALRQNGIKDIGWDSLLAEEADSWLK